jgi:hypothetical protein
MARYSWVMLVNATPGKEQAFEDWLRKEHAPDCLNEHQGGWKSCQIYRVADSQLSDAAPEFAGQRSREFQYCVVYQIETDDLQKFLETHIKTAKEEGWAFAPDNLIDVTQPGVVSVFAPSGAPIVPDPRYSRAAARSN